MVITDIPVLVLGLDACTAYVTGRAMHLPHKEGHGRASKYLEQVHVDIAGLMPVASVGGHNYLCVVIDDFTCAVYTHLLHLKSEAVNAFKAFKAMVENKLGREVREVMMDNVHELSMSKMCQFCKANRIKLSTTIPYCPASNGITKCTIGVLTSSVCVMLAGSGLPKSLWAEGFNMATYV